jgi:hypothetical protein
MTPVTCKILLTFPKWYNAMKLPIINNAPITCNFVIQEVSQNQLIYNPDTMEVSMLSHGKKVSLIHHLKNTVQLKAART